MTQPKTSRGPRKERRSPSTFLNAVELAHALGGASPKTLTEWIADGTVPPPHSRVGERTRLWLRSDFDEFVKTGRWPQEAYRRGWEGERTGDAS